MKILVAGIGNIFLADDGFGVAVAQLLAKRSLPDGVKVVDFGIRGLDLVYAMLEDYEAFIFVDIVSRGQAPGTLYLIEPQIDESAQVMMDAHGMEPTKVLALAQTMGAVPKPTYLVACEPAMLVTGETYEDVMVDLSAPVRAAVEGAAQMVEELAARLIRDLQEDENEIVTSGLVRRDGGSGNGDFQGNSRHDSLLQNEVDVSAT